MLFSSKKTICIRGKLWNLDTPLVMGILNVTPDSFFDGGKYQAESNILRRAEQILTEGGTIIDIGGYSSRPNAEDISVEEEQRRVIPAIEWVLKYFPESIISIDTFRAGIAQKAVEAGASIINDIAGGRLDKEMFPLLGQLQVPYILMHLQGTPQNMTKQTHYQAVLGDIVDYFIVSIKALQDLGVKDIILDTGFGFSKNLHQNYYLLNHLSYLQALGKPILTGVSRKSMIYKALQTTAEEALNGTTVLNTIALLKNTQILRVHDVKEAVEAVRLIKTLNTHEGEY
jgi:dihydropteroate synthase